MYEYVSHRSELLCTLLMIDGLSQRILVSGISTSTSTSGAAAVAPHEREIFESNANAYSESEIELKVMQRFLVFFCFVEYSSQSCVFSCLDI